MDCKWIRLLSIFTAAIYRPLSKLWHNTHHCSGLHKQKIQFSPQTNSYENTMQHEDKINLQIKSKAVFSNTVKCGIGDWNATLKQKVEISILYEKNPNFGGDWKELQAILAMQEILNCDTLKLLESSPDKRESRTSEVKSRTRRPKAHETATSNTQQWLSRKDLLPFFSFVWQFKLPVRPRTQQHR